jgi:periplasmic copper chaperone A
VRGLLAISALTIWLTGGAMAANMAEVGNVVIHDAWANATLGRSQNSAAYMIIEVSGDRSDRLIAASSPLADKAQLHNHIMEGGVAKMRPVDAVEVSPGAPAVLQPGGLHIMLMGLKEPLVDGARLPLTLTFETAGKIKLEVPVMAMAAGMQHRHGEEAKPATN